MKKSILLVFFTTLFSPIHAIDQGNIKVACVKKKNDILEQENNLQKSRLPLIKKNLEKILEIKLDDKRVPIISVCCSGGGFRSMIATTGLLCGLDDIKLLKSTMHIATLSGSTWTLIPWLLEDKPINQFKDELTTRLHTLYNSKKLSKLSIKNIKFIQKFIKDTYNDFLKTKKTKLKYGQKTSSIDWFGSLLSNLLLSQFNEKRFDLKLSDLTKTIETGKKPLPIFTAVSHINNNNDYQWLEFNPFYIGSSYVDSYIPSWAFGRKFNNGKSVDLAPEPNLGYLMGKFGSAFCSSLKDALHKSGTLLLPKEIKSFIQKTETKISNFGWANKKFSPAQVANFTFNLKDSPIKNTNHLELVDGGYAYNLPLKPLLEEQRKPDIIIVLDSSTQKFLRPANALKQAEKELTEQGHKFPPIDYKKAVTQNLSIFRDENDPDCPIIIFIPLQKDVSYSKTFNPATSKFCKTTNFSYSKNQAEQLAGLTEHVIKNNKNVILDLIKEVVSSK